jgi:general secretion pathway protein D
MTAMKVKISKAPREFMPCKPKQVLKALALTLSVTSCEYIGPQLHEKMPLPQPAPISDAQFAQPDATQANADAAKNKTAQVELFSDYENSFNSVASQRKWPKTDGKGEYSLNFDDADLGEVCKVILSDILGRNYTISPQVSGKVTLQTTKPLSKSELMPTLEMLLSINNAGIVEQEGMYLIKPANEAVYNTSIKTIGSSALPSGYQTQVIPVHNASAADLAEILKPLMPEKAQVNADTKRNILLVSGSGSELSRIIDVVNTFDVDIMRGRSFGLFTPAHVDAAKIIDELDQIFNDKSTGSKTSTDKSSGDKSAGEKSTDPNSFFRFIEIERLNAILAITHNAKYLHDIESWVLRLDKTSSEAAGGVNVYRAQHVDAVDLADTLGSIFGSGGSSGSRSASIASGRRSTSASNKKKSSDSKDSLSDRTLSDRTQNTRNNSLGGSSVGGGEAMMPNVKIIADEGNNALIVVANSEEWSKIQRVIKQLDVLPLQVLIDATIVEVTLKDDLQYGIQWYFMHENGGSNEISGGSVRPNISFQDIGKGVASGGLTYLFASNSGDIKALLQANATKNNINVISSPSLMVLNNQEASIKVGDTVPTLTSSTTNTSSSTDNGSNVTSQITPVDTGINLSIKPRVNSGGLVLMDILQTANQAIKNDTSEIDSPIIQKREIESSVAIQSGETIVLGGLIKEDNTNNKSGVPVLHEIPWIGSLFGGTTRNKDRSELVVLITPRVVGSRQDAQSITDEFRRKLSSIYDVPPVVEVYSEPVN